MQWKNPGLISNCSKQEFLFTIVPLLLPSLAESAYKIKSRTQQALRRLPIGLSSFKVKWHCWRYPSTDLHVREVSLASQTIYGWWYQQPSLYISISCNLSSYIYYHRHLVQYSLVIRSHSRFSTFFTFSFTSSRQNLLPMSYREIMPSSMKYELIYETQAQKATIITMFRRLMSRDLYSTKVEGSCWEARSLLTHFEVLQPIIQMMLKSSLATLSMYRRLESFRSCELAIYFGDWAIQELEGTAVLKTLGPRPAQNQRASKTSKEATAATAWEANASLQDGFYKQVTGKQPAEIEKTEVGS